MMLFVDMCVASSDTLGAGVCFGVFCMTRGDDLGPRICLDYIISGEVRN